MKKLSFFSLILMIVFIFSACSDDSDTNTIGDDEIIETTAELTLVGDCDSLKVNGNYQAGVVLDESHFAEVTVNVTKTGTYNFETEQTNGYSFKASGVFTETGEQKITFVATGIPEKAKEDYKSFKFGNATCGKYINVYDEGMPNLEDLVILFSGEPFMGDNYITYALSGQGELLWSKTGFSNPSVEDNKAYIVLNDVLYCFNVLTGEEYWSTPQDMSSFQNGISIDNNYLYVVNSGGLFALNKSDGSVAWNYLKTRYVNFVTPTVVDGIVYTAFSDSVVAINQGGTEKWKYYSENTIRSSPAIADGRLYFGNDRGLLTALNISDGSFVWSFNIGSTGEESPTVVNGKLYMQGKTSLYCLDAADGTEVWNYEITYEGSWSTPTVENEIVYATGVNNGVMAFNALTGEELWNNNAPAPSVSISPTVYDALLVAGGNAGLAAINAKSGFTIWQYGEFDPWNIEDNILVKTPAVIYNIETNTTAYSAESGNKQ